VLLWKLGLSYRASSLILSGLEVLVSFMTIWRDVQAEAGELKRAKRWKRVRALGLDGASVLGWGEKQGVLVAVDLGTGEPLAVGRVNEYDPQAVRRWLEPLVQRHGITVIVTDDLSSYKIVAEKLQLGHQICQFHVRRWVGRTLKELQETVPKEWLWVVEEIRQLMDVYRQTAETLVCPLETIARALFQARQARTPLEQLRDLLLRLVSTGIVLHLSIRARDPLDQQCHRACHRAHKNESPNGSRLQILARDGNRSAHRR
jgi:transposase-like protein